MKDNIKNASTGTAADVKGGVEIATVFGGYFSRPETAKTFCDIGMSKVLDMLPKQVSYADFGGGDGYLAKKVADYLTSQEKEVNTIVVDANDDYLDKAKKYELVTKMADLRVVDLSEQQDLITMRAVNHYSDLLDQLKIINNTYKNLKEGGVLISQVSSGSYENCDLRSKIVNIPSLGRVASGKYYHWTSVTEYITLLKLVGFKDVKLLGYAPSNAWGPEEQWDRFHVKETAEAMEANDIQGLSAIETQKRTFLKTAYALIDIYEAEYTNDLGVSRKSDGTSVIEYTYPIIVGFK